MKFNAIIKPEGTALTKEIVSYFENHRFSRSLTPLSKGISTLRENSLLTSEIMSRTRKGIFTEDILKLVYSDYYSQDSQTFQRIVAKYLNQPFWAVEVDIEGDQHEIFKLLNSIKGRMSISSPSLATGLRGSLLRNRTLRNADFYKDTEWKETGNFLHFPDNDIENQRCADAVKLIDGNPFEIWDAYKLFDRDIFLTKQRSSKEVEEIIYNFSPAHFPIVFDIGCGGGRISETLSKIGYKVYGIDFDGLEVEKAEESDRKGYYHVSTIKKFQFPSSVKCNLAIFAYGSFVGMNFEDIEIFFKHALSHMENGGALWLDLLDIDFVKEKSKGESRDLTEKVNLDQLSIKSIKRSRTLKSETIEITEFILEYQDGNIRSIRADNNILPRSIIECMLKKVGFTNIQIKKPTPERIIITCHKND